MAATAIAQGDWEQYRDQVRVKKVIADKLTPEQYEAHVDKMARFIAAQRQQAATPKIDDGIRAPGDTCVAATPEISSLPFNTAGTTVGATDEIGLHATEDRLHLHDFHATILRLLGLDHMGLVYHHKNRPERPTLNEGAPCEKIING